ncbi:MAG: protein phosphatase 2C domain-containing protein [Ruminococcus sp.]|nr:protein phosphatase 2C domain-containing protein [Ruminococcus sp.]
MYYCCGITDKGIMPHNEDAFLIDRSVNDSGTFQKMTSCPFTVAVSDGVSGENSGEFASRMCLEYIRDMDFSQNTDMERSLMEVHRRLAQYSFENPDMNNMQATLCGLFFGSDDSIKVFNVGDSRLYRFRGGRIRQISRDQSLVQLLYEEGAITLEQRRTHARRNIIFPVFGSLSAEPEIDIIELGAMQYGDILLLCTDGLSDYISAVDMEEILELPKKLPERLEMMVRKALENGCTDNITVTAVVYYNRPV